MATVSKCPDRDRLGRLLSDTLPEPESSRLASHLEDCPDCRSTLEGLAAESRLWNELPRLRNVDGGLSNESDHEEDDPSALVRALNFLEPSGNPEHLGRLGPYEVLGVVGRGGMGVVLKARDEALDRLVAIKVLTPSLSATGAARRRFAREAKAAAAVVHEHVVAIHAVDATPGGLPSLVMQYVGGKSLQERIDRDGPLEVREVVRIGLQSSHALAAAHAQGLIHRDVKPANILLENGVERVKITDFGLARAVDDATMTQSGVVAGTPQYMAPEQARGEAVDHRADLFSLGSVLYAMCTGRAPFRGSSSIATLRRVCEDSPPPIQSINPEVPGWLCRIVSTLHAKDPAGRYTTAAEVADLLERCLVHLQQPASTPLPSELQDSPAPRFDRRRAADYHIGCSL